MECKNCVVTFKLNTIIDLTRVARLLPNCEYAANGFSALVYRRKGGCTCLLFANGKVVLSGAKNEERAKKAGRQFARLLQKLIEPKVQFRDFQVRNLVYRSRFPHVRPRLNMELLDSTKTNFPLLYFRYDPELFPGLHIFDKNKKVCILVFSTGSVMITGVKAPESLPQYEKILTQIAQNYLEKKIAL
jgi:transcription initiation factor TFIID TATA-box-binding protein